MDIEQILFQDLDRAFAGEIGLRTLVMYTVILAFLRLSGKKSIGHVGPVRTATLEISGAVKRRLSPEPDAQSLNA